MKFILFNGAYYNTAHIVSMRLRSTSIDIVTSQGSKVTMHFDAGAWLDNVEDCKRYWHILEKEIGV